jgi:hypothetical protein
MEDPAGCQSRLAQTSWRNPIARRPGIQETNKVSCKSTGSRRIGCASRHIHLAGRARLLSRSSGGPTWREILHGEMSWSCPGSSGLSVSPVQGGDEGPQGSAHSIPRPGSRRQPLLREQNDWRDHPKGLRPARIAPFASRQSRLVGLGSCTYTARQGPLVHWAGSVTGVMAPPH